MFDLFVPGSVIGMVLLFILLSLKIIKGNWIEIGASFMVRHLAFFFIPATVGLMSYPQLFMGNGFLLIVIVFVSTVLVMVLSGLISQSLIRGGIGRTEDD